ncbi:uncharacterized protein [Amphiura filiformis]|uniref:uncharacterized protein n=1 Tax=Amphiura filiformis TaxID=82378 RepID=UPI003B219A60
MDALESLHMSQAWDDETPKNEMEDGDDDDEEEVEDEGGEEGDLYNTPNSTLEELEDALISITNADEAQKSALPQYDGPGDEEEEPAALVPVVEVETKRRRNIQKPSRYLEDDDFYFVPSIKPKSAQGKKKQRKKNIKKSNFDTPSTSGTDASNNSPKDKLLKEFVIKITDRFDEEMIKKIPYWNPVLEVRKLSHDSIDEFVGFGRAKEGQDKDDGTIWGVKQDSLSKGMVKKTLGIKSINATTQDLLSKAPPSHKNQTSSSKKVPVKRTLGIKRRREPSGDASDSSNTSAASHYYSMRTKRERVMYREDDDFDEILELTDYSRTRGDEVDDGDDDDDSDVDRDLKSWKTYDSPMRYKQPLVILNKATLSQTINSGKGRKSTIQHTKFISKLSSGRKHQQKEESVLSDLSMETDNDSAVEVIEETTSDEDEITVPEDDMAMNNVPLVGSKEMVDSDPVSTGSEECDVVSPTLFEDTIISPQSTAEASRGEQEESMGVSSLPEKKDGGNAAAPSQDTSDINDSKLYPIHMGDNARSRIYSSLPASPTREGMPPFRRGCRTRGGKRHFGQAPSRASSYSPDQWGPPMFRIGTDESKEEYCDVMWRLSYFSPLRPDPEPSPPRAWSPTRLAMNSEDNVPWISGNNYDAKKNGDILTTLSCFDSDQMMQEMAEFGRDHDLFQSFTCQPNENIEVTGEGASKIVPEDSEATRSKDTAETSMEFDAVPESQSEEDESTGGEVKTTTLSVGEPNNNIGSGCDEKNPSTYAGESKVSDLTSQQDDDAAAKKYEPIKPLEMRGDPSKKVVGTVHPTQHVKSTENELERQSSEESDKVLFDLDQGKIETAAIKTRADSLSAGLKSPLDADPNVSMVPSSNPMSLMSPTGHPSRFFPVLKQNDAIAPKDSTSLNDIHDTNTSVSGGEMKMSLQEDEVQNRTDPPATTDSQQSDSSSPLTPGQRQQETRHSPTPNSPSDSEDSSNEGKSTSSTPVDFDFLSTLDEKTDKTSDEIMSNVGSTSVGNELSTEPASGDLSEVADVEHSDGTETPASNVVTPWKTFSSNFMTPVKAANGDSLSFGSNEGDSIAGSKSINSGIAQGDDQSKPSETFTGDALTSAKADEGSLNKDVATFERPQAGLSDMEYSSNSGCQTFSSTDDIMTPVKTPLETCADDVLTTVKADEGSLNKDVATFERPQAGHSEMEDRGNSGWETFSSTDDIMTPVKTLLETCADDVLTSLKADEGSLNKDIATIERSQAGQSEMEHGGNSGWETFSSTDDIMTPAKTALSSEQTAVNREQSLPDSDEENAVSQSTKLDVVEETTLTCSSNISDSKDTVLKSSLPISEISKVEITNDAVAMENDPSGKCENVSESLLPSSGKTQEVCAVEIHEEGQLDKGSSLLGLDSKIQKPEMPNSEPLQEASESDDFSQEKIAASEKDLDPAGMPSSSSSMTLPECSQSGSQNAKENPQPIPFQSQTSAFTVIKPKVVPTGRDASRSPTKLAANRTIQVVFQGRGNLMRFPMDVMIM